MLGGSLALAFSPLVTHALRHVPVLEAADASGLFTTTVQLGQAIGVAVFGSVFLTLAAHPAPHASGHALATTLYWLGRLGRHRHTRRPAPRPQQRQSTSGIGARGHRAPRFYRGISATPWATAHGAHSGTSTSPWKPVASLCWITAFLSHISTSSGV